MEAEDSHVKLITREDSLKRTAQAIKSRRFKTGSLAGQGMKRGKTEGATNNEGRGSEENSISRLKEEVRTGSFAGKDIRRVREKTECVMNSKGRGNGENSQSS